MSRIVNNYLVVKKILYVLPNNRLQGLRRRVWYQISSVCVSRCGPPHLNLSVRPVAMLNLLTRGIYLIYTGGYGTRRSIIEMHWV